MDAGDGDREMEEEGTSNPAKESSFGSSPSNCELVNGNGFSIASDSGGNSSGAAEVRTYKRRKISKKSSPERKYRKYKREEAGATLHVENQMSKELVDSALDGTVSEQAENAPTVLEIANGPHGQWRRVIVEQIYHSLGDDCCVHGCLGDALAHVIEINKVAIKEPKFCAEARPVHSAQAGSKATYNGDALEVASNVSLGQSDLPTVNQMCQHALCDIITSEKFNLLCKLLVENFEGAKVDRLLDFSIINVRTNEGIYERYPVLFLSDTKQLAKLAQHSSSGGGNCEVNGGNPQSDDKWKVAKNHGFYNECTCRHCGERTDDQKCVVCHSCEDTYHVSCIKPSVEEIPPRNW